MKETKRNFSGHGTRVKVSAAGLRLLVRMLSKDEAGMARYLHGCPELLGEIAETCNRSGLSIVLLRALEGSPLLSTISTHQIDSLNEARQLQEERLKSLLPALLKLTQLFESRKQPFILLKGPYLAKRFYGDILGREYVDLDLLVPNGDRAKACALMEHAGYRRQSGTLLHEDLTRFFVHAFDFSSGNVNVDLHWSLSRHLSLHLSDEQLWAQCSLFDIEGLSFHVLSEEHEVIFASLSLLRDIERGRPKPKNIIDMIRIAIALDSRLEWDKLLSAGDGTAGPLQHVLRLCLEITDASDLVPYLAAALNRRSGRRLPSTVNASFSQIQFKPAFLGLGHKLWAARAYEGGLTAWLFWWALSLPFRLAVHRKPPYRSRPR